MRFAFSPALALLLLAGSAQANLVSNGSFETATATQTTQFQLAGVSDWTTTTDGQALVTPSWFTNGYLFNTPWIVGLAGAFPATSPDGGNFAISDSDYHTGPIQQTISGLNPGDSYVLSFYQALDQDVEPPTNPGPVSAHWQVTLGTDVQITPTMFADGGTGAFSPWALQTMTFTASGTSEVLSFLAIGSGEPPIAMLDGVDLEAAAPEPAALGLTGIGLALLMWKLVVLRRQRLRA